MSKIAFTPNANGSGVFTLASPNSNTNRTLTLPDESGTLLTSVGGTTGNLTVSGNLSVDGGTIKLDGNYPVGTNNVALGNLALSNGSLSGISNTAIGTQSMTGNTSGQNNVGLGTAALYTNSTGQGNTSVGSNALFSNTTASENTAVGYQSLYNSNAADNTAIGTQSQKNTTSGSNNTSVGAGSSYGNTTGSYNTSLGRSALQNNTTASNNTAVGYQAGYNSTTGTEITALGAYAVENNTTANFTTGVGASALYSNTTGAANVAVGAAPLYNNTTGANNIAIGRQALFYNTTAGSNTAVGYQAGYTNTTGTYNTFVGTVAGLSNTTSSSNTYLGEYAGRLTTGGQNTFLGAASGHLVTTGQKNTILGRFTGNQGGLDIRTSNNNIVLSDGDGNPRMRIDSSGNIEGTASASAFKAPMIQATNGSVSSYAGTTPTMHSPASGTLAFSMSGAERMRIDSSGDLLLGTTSSDARLTVYEGAGWAGSFGRNAGGTHGVIRFTHDGTQVGYIAVSSTATSYVTSSDYRLKENVNYTWDATTRLKQLKPARFNFIADADTTVDGFLAHEAQAVVPEAVTGTHNEVDDDGNAVMQGIDQSKLVPLLVKTIQELEARITALEA